MHEAVQLSDIVGIDIFGNMGPKYVESFIALEPRLENLRDAAIPITWYYMATTLEPAESTPDNFKIQPNVTYDDCPRDLDIVITGGPLPSHRPPQADRFIKEAWETTRVWMTTCVGGLWIASAGVMDGLKATTNRGALEIAKQAHPDVNWVDQRWIVEEKPFKGDGKGELWTAGGAGCGIDMIATYALQNFDPEAVTRLSLIPLEFDLNEGHGQFYTRKEVAF